MSRKQIDQLKPLFSVVIIIFCLFSLVFLQMETRRMGYVLLKQSRDYKAKVDRSRLELMEYANVTRPERVRGVALNKLTLNVAKQNQIIHMAGERIAIRQ